MNVLSDFFLGIRNVRDRGPVASWICVALPSGKYRSDMSVTGTLEESVSESPKGMCDPTLNPRRQRSGKEGHSSQKRWQLRRLRLRQRGEGLEKKGYCEVRQRKLWER